MNLAEHIAELHAAADYVDELMPAPSRPVQPRCRRCGKTIELSVGRHSKKWFWSHVNLSDCDRYQIGNRKFYDTKAEADAEAAVQTISAPPNQTVV